MRPLVSALAFLALTVPAYAQVAVCALPLVVAKQNVINNGGTWLGEFGAPALGTEGLRFVYYAVKNGTMYVTIVNDADCVWIGHDLPVGKLEEKGVPA